MSFPHLVTPPHTRLNYQSFYTRFQGSRTLLLLQNTTFSKLLLPGGNTSKKHVMKTNPWDSPPFVIFRDIFYARWNILSLLYFSFQQFGKNFGPESILFYCFQLFSYLSNFRFYCFSWVSWRNHHTYYCLICWYRLFSLFHRLLTSSYTRGATSTSICTSKKSAFE